MLLFPVISALELTEVDSDYVGSCVELANLLGLKGIEVSPTVDNYESFLALPLEDRKRSLIRIKASIRLFDRVKDAPQQLFLKLRERGLTIHDSIWDKMKDKTSVELFDLSGTYLWFNDIFIANAKQPLDMLYSLKWADQVLLSDEEKAKRLKALQFAIENGFCEVNAVAEPGFKTVGFKIWLDSAYAVYNKHDKLPAGIVALCRKYEPEH